MCCQPIFKHKYKYKYKYNYKELWLRKRGGSCVANQSSSQQSVTIMLTCYTALVHYTLGVGRRKWAGIREKVGERVKREHSCLWSISEIFLMEVFIHCNRYSTQFFIHCKGWGFINPSHGQFLLTFWENTNKWIQAYKLYHCLFVKTWVDRASEIPIQIALQTLFAGESC